MRHFLLENAHRDIYFNPASLRHSLPRKAQEVRLHRIGLGLGLHRPAQDDDGPRRSCLAGKTRPSPRYEGSDLPPAHIVVFSVRGLWLYWRLPNR